MGSKARETDDMGEAIFADSNIKTDSARIYISQKTDIDKNFGLPAGGVGMHEGRSGIGIKADHIRIVGREGIKIVTKTDVENSQGGKVLSTHGIDLIAGGDDKGLQPMVKGDNLKLAISHIMNLLGDLASRVHEHIIAQTQYNLQLQEHIHVVPPTGPTIMVGNIPLRFSNGQTSISNLKTDIMLHADLYNAEAYKEEYLLECGPNYICSAVNKVN